MGVQQSQLYPVTPVDKQAHRAAERVLKEAKNKLEHQHRVLLLGSGDSGKSTVVKQMRLIHSQHFSPAEIETFRQLVFNNLIDGIKLILAAMREFSASHAAAHAGRDTSARDCDSRDGRLLEPKNLAYAQMVVSAPDIRDGQAYPPEFEDALRALWEDAGVRRVRERGNEIALPENLSYFFADLPRLFAPSYKPTNQDILHTRVRTIGISENTFRPPRNPSSELVVIDVGGQKNERRKWIHCFEDVSCVLYLASLSGYDQCLVEDRGCNQMDDALILWSQICLSPWFKRASLILFLNKEDLFRAKIATSPIKKTFPDYDGKPDDVGAAKAFFKRRFMKLARVSERAAYNTLALGPGYTDIVGLGCTEDHWRKGPLGSNSVSEPTSPTGVAFPTSPGAGVASTPRKSSALAGLRRARSARRRVESESKASKKEAREEKEGHVRSADSSTHGIPRPTARKTKSDDREKEKERQREREKKEREAKKLDRPFTATRQIFAHFTNATDTALLRVVMGAVEDLSIRAHLAEQHLL